MLDPDPKLGFLASYEAGPGRVGFRSCCPPCLVRVRLGKDLLRLWRRGQRGFEEVGSGRPRMGMVSLVSGVGETKVVEAATYSDLMIGLDIGRRTIYQYQNQMSCHSKHHKRFFSKFITHKNYQNTGESRLCQQRTVWRCSYSNAYWKNRVLASHVIDLGCMHMWIALTMKEGLLCYE